MLKLADKRLALRFASSWSGYSADRGRANLCVDRGGGPGASKQHLQNDSRKFQVDANRLCLVNCLTPSRLGGNQVGLFSHSLVSVRHLSITAVSSQAAESSTESKPGEVSDKADAIPDAVTCSEAAAAKPDPAAADAVVTSSAESASDSARPALDFVLPDKPVPTGSGLSIEYAPGVDPPLDAVGLGSWWPSGRVQVLLDYMHNTLDLHWCGTILITTVCMRLLIFPLVVMAQTNMANLFNNNAEMTKLQEKMTIARQRGDILETAKAGADLQTFMKEKNINPLKNMVPIMGQMPIFISMFVGLRGLANLPLESMETGGLSWFSDLTIPDPYYGLPLILAGSTFLQIKLGADGMNVATMRGGQNSPFVKLFMYGIPCILFPATMNFAAAAQFYWVCNNFISIGQAKVIRTKSLRRVLGVPELKRQPEPEKKKKKVGLVQSVKDSISNFKAQAEIVDRRAHDERLFREIGSSKPKRTFKFDPTKSQQLLKK